MVDPSAFGTFDLASTYGRGLQLRNMQEQQQNRQRLGDLLPQAVNGDQAAINQIAQIDPEVFLKLNDQQKAQAAAELDDLTAAVRWADTPEKWAQVQQYYTAHGHDVSQYPFESREASLIALGKMGDYLKMNEQPNQPSSVREYQFARSQGYGGSFQDWQAQNGSPIMVDNGDGTKTLYPRSMLSGGQSTTPPPPPPGFQLDGGPTPQASGGFPR